MQIVLHPLPSGQPIPLTGNRPSEGIGGGTLQHSRLVEAVARIRADAIRMVDRGNLSHTLAFTITREHATPGAAGLYWLTHAQGIPASCDVDFLVQEPSGSTAAEVVLAGAHVLASAGDWQGHSTTFAYQITGGRLTVSAI